MRKAATVKTSLSIDGSGDRVVLLYWATSEEQRFRNIVRLEQDGSIQWRVELPGRDERDCFVSLQRRGDRFCGKTFAGHEIEFDGLGHCVTGVVAR